MREIIHILSDEITSYDLKIRDINRLLTELRPIYKVLKPGNKSYDDSNIARITNDKKLLTMTTKICEKTNYIPLDNMLKEKKKYADEKKSIVDKLLNVEGEKNVLQDDEEKFVAAVEVRSESGKRYYERLIELDDILHELNSKIVHFIFDSIIELFEKNNAQKEEIKRKQSPFKYALKSIKRNERLLPSEVALVINLLIEKGREDLVPNLKEYCDSHVKKEEVTPEPIKTEKEPIHYTDLNEPEKEVEYSDYEYEEDNLLFENYVLVLKDFKSISDIEIFIKSVTTVDNIHILINELLSYIETNNITCPDLKSSLEELSYKYVKEDTPTISSDKPLILYYDFLCKKNRIYDDIYNISQDYYAQILKGINLIKENGAKHIRRRVVQLNKIYKLKVGSIRITFKRLDNNTYIILGIFKKNDYHGDNVIEGTQRRNNKFSSKEKMFLDSIKKEEFKNSYIEANNEMDKAIITLLSGSKIKK